MLNKLRGEIAECYQHAEGCAQAEIEPDPGLRQDFLDMEKRWLFLVRSYELTEQLERYLLAVRGSPSAASVAWRIP